MAPTPVRAYGAEGRLAGQRPDDAAIADAARLAAQSASPISDVRSGAGYRRQMVSVLAQRALAHAAATAAGDDAPSFQDIRRRAVQTAA